MRGPQSGSSNSYRRQAPRGCSYPFVGYPKISIVRRHNFEGRCGRLSNGPQNIEVQNPGTRECDRPGQKELHRRDEVKDPEMGRLSCIVSRGPKCNQQVSLLEKGREESNMPLKQHATLRALKMEEGTQLRNKKKTKKKNQH